MKMKIRQRLFSWFDSFDVTDEVGERIFTVEGKLNWGHCFHIMDGGYTHVATLKEVVLTFLPKFEMYLGDRYWGCLQKKLTFFRPQFVLEANGWQIEGNWTEWDYAITDGAGNTVATVGKELLNWTDTYVMDTARDEDALGVLLVVLAIDAEKCSRN